VFDSLLLNIVVFLYAIVAPGIAFAWMALRDRDLLVLITVGLTLGVFAMPLLIFVLAVAFGTYFSPALILGTATFVLLAAFVIERIGRRREVQPE
jgi:hypothetical protein